MTQIYFRRNKEANNVKLHYKLILFPYTNIFAMIVLIFVMITMTQMDDMRLSVFVAPLWIFVLSIFYMLRKKTNDTKRIQKKITKKQARKSNL